MKARANRRHVPRTSIRANQSKNRGEQSLFAESNDRYSSDGDPIGRIS